uniref:Uncharacterized protein n=1 Tax=Panagrellus redivivus TaxID=6233 RepID=A0A7E4W567_PANRE
MDDTTIKPVLDQLTNHFIVVQLEATETQSKVTSISQSPPAADSLHDRRLSLPHTICNFHHEKPGLT